MNHDIRLIVAAIVSLVAVSGCSVESSGNSGLSAHKPAAIEAPIERMTTPADQAGRPWAPAATADITPGVQTYTQDGQCTTNFVFVDDAGNTYIGQSAHCAGTGESKEGDGCTSGSLPLGTPVTFNRGGSLLSNGEVIASGELAYSSWITMQQLAEKDVNTCAYNDFALVKIDAADVGRVNPSVPFWGGPADINTTDANPDDQVFGYGNSSFRFGITELSPQTGTSNADDTSDGGWSHKLTAPTPGVPGDSGSAFLDAHGRALGTLSTMSLSLPVENAVGDLSRELAYARDHSGITGLKLVLGTEPFDPSS